MGDKRLSKKQKIAIGIGAAALGAAAVTATVATIAPDKDLEEIILDDGSKVYFDPSMEEVICDYGVFLDGSEGTEGFN